MSRKDFELIANTLKGLPLWNSNPTEAYQVVLEFASTLRKTNERFDAERFTSACIPNGINPARLYGSVR